MPLPKPETKNEFIERCMADDEAIAEFPERDQRFAVCQSIWDASKVDEDELDGDVIFEIVKDNLD